MEVFKVFATMSLVDMITGPLKKIGLEMDATGNKANGLGQRMGKLALAMAPVAIAAGVVLGALTSTASAAMTFESAMADVAKVIDFDSPEEFTAMNRTVMDLAGNLPMAAEGIAAIVAAAGQTGVAKHDLTEFAEQATKMGVAFDLAGADAGKMMADWRAGMKLPLERVYALADAVNHLSNNMNATAPALGEVLQRVGALGMASGLAETQVAALGTAMLSAGSSPEIVSTAMRNMLSTLVQGESMSKSAAATFKKLGFSVSQMAKDMQTDAQGTIFKVLQAIADKPKELQLSMLSDMFGEQSLSAIAPLLGNMDNLSKAFTLVGDAAAYAGSMQAEFDARSKTTENALQLMRNRFTNLSITIGNAFLPVIGWGADKLGVLAEAARWVTETPFGQWLLKIVAALSGALVGITALAAGMWALSLAGPLVAKTLAPVTAAIFSISWPVWAVIAAMAALYLAYKTNFGGMADAVDGWWQKLSLVFRGVKAIFTSLKDGVGEVRGELATEIKAAGLAGLVTSISRVIYRAMAVFDGFWSVIQAAGKELYALLAPPLTAVANAAMWAGGLLTLFADSANDAAAGTQVDTWKAWGQVLGITAVTLALIFGGIKLFLAVMGVVAFGVKAWAVAQMLLNATLLGCPVMWLVAGIAALAGAAYLIITNWGTIKAWWSGLWSGIGAAVTDGWDSVTAACQTAWASVTGFFSGINLFESGAAIIDTLINGIKNKAGAMVDSVKETFGKVRNLLPFSDAKEGPLSALTASGGAIMSTLGQGVLGNAGALRQSVTGALQGAGRKIGEWQNALGETPLSGLVTPGTVAMPDASGISGLAAPFPTNTVTAPVPVPAGASTPAFDFQGAFFSALSGIGQKINSITQAIIPVQAPALPMQAIPAAPEFATDADPKTGDRRGGLERGGKSLVVHIGQLILPNATDSKSFLEELENFVSEFGGDVSEA